MNMIMFLIGSAIFIAYMFGLLTMINNAHKDQANTDRHTLHADEMDMDGMGNFSRMPSNIKVKKRNARKKKKTVRRQLVDDRKSK